MYRRKRFGKYLTGGAKNSDEKWIAKHGAVRCENTADKHRYLTICDLKLRVRRPAVYFFPRDHEHRPGARPDIEGMQVEVDSGLAKHSSRC